MTPDRHGDHGPAAAVAWIAAVLAMAGSVAAGLLGWASNGSAEVSWKALLLPILWSVPAALIAAGRPRLALGWLMLAGTILFVGTGVAQAWVGYALTVGNDAAVGWAVWFTDRASALLVPCWLVALLLLPDGRLPAPGWRPVTVAVVSLQVGVVAAFSLVRGPAAGPDSSFPDAVLDVANPVGILPSGVGAVLDGLDLYVLQLPLLLVPVAVAVRLWRGRGEERTRVMAVLLAGAAFVLIVVLGHGFWPEAAGVLDVLAGAVLAAVLTASVLRRRLREIDYVVHRSVVYVALTTVIACGYLAVSAVLSAVGHPLPRAGAGLVAAVLALLLLPLRSFLQRHVARLLYGDRADPYAAISRLMTGAQKAPTVASALGEVAASVAASLRVRRTVARVGEQQVELGPLDAAGRDVSVPLMSGDQRVGELTVTVPPGRSWRDDDLRLLTDLGRHGGMMVHAVVLAEELRAGRQRVVEAREEERRRVGRDLHDELGPTIASLTMQLGAVRRLLESDPAAAGTRLQRLEGMAREALEEIRRVARGLRPPALDQLGLVGALVQVADSLGVSLTVTGTDPPELPAAVEVAAYRIGAEAVANVARHTESSAADLVVTVQEGELLLSVVDRGEGISDELPAGVGLAAMRERAEELGGSCRVTSTVGAGTAVLVTLPLQPAGLVVGP